MKPSSNVCGTTTKVPSKRQDKKRINIRWNSGIFFQLGLVVSLLAMFFVMEIEVGVGNPGTIPDNSRIWEDNFNTAYVIEKPVEVPIEKPKTTKLRTKVQVTQPISQTFASVPDDSKVIEGKTIVEDNPVTTTMPQGNTVVKVPETKNMLGVEFAPIYPGCEGIQDKGASVECLSSKIRAFIGKKFDTGKFDYFEPGSIQKIQTMFTIDVNGRVVDIKVRANDKKLEAEAKKVLQQLPQMTPGKQGQTQVNVSYAVPISFKVNN